MDKRLTNQQREDVFFLVLQMKKQKPQKKKQKRKLREIRIAT
jgi:hypothetical protein